ncbi:ATP-binding cassette domain-containing protein [Devosia algicola]|uniref:ATP-binding cassette domain-containing protein n=1 Tax=Devosia algicola TaxID=3026418 RepID=A0ABY7YJG1_9HYPH|nr:ATP-binding cassette domain-containing protein [Devosia algicola]WDR01318.1 ATP-binding cassette domain-containing protein [Devosia algicola]
MSDNGSILDVRNLTLEFQLRRGNLIGVDDVSFSMGAGETLGLVGESGAGKSTIAFALTKAPGFCGQNHLRRGYLQR